MKSVDSTSSALFLGVSLIKRQVWRDEPELAKVHILCATLPPKAASCAISRSEKVTEEQGDKLVPIAEFDGSASRTVFSKCASNDLWAVARSTAQRIW